MVKSQATRSRSQNRKIARLLLADRLDNMEKGPESRAAIKGAAVKKKKASKNKKAQRKYRALAQEKEDEHDGHEESQAEQTRGKNEDGLEDVGKI